VPTCTSPIQVLRSKVESRKSEVLGHVLTRAARLFSAEAVGAIQDGGFPEVRESWIGILRHMDPDGVRTSDLARRMGITKQGAGQLVTDLEGFGYLERIPDPTDGRAKLVRMTERGWAAWLAGLEAMAELERSLLADIPAEQCDELRGSLTALVGTLERRSAVAVVGTNA